MGKDMSQEEIAEKWRRRSQETIARLKGRKAFGPPEPVYTYSLSFRAVPSTFDRIRQYVKEQPTWNRSYSRYDPYQDIAPKRIGKEGDADGEEDDQEEEVVPDP